MRGKKEGRGRRREGDEGGEGEEEMDAEVGEGRQAGERRRREKRIHLVDKQKKHCDRHKYPKNISKNLFLPVPILCNPAAS